MVKYIKIIDIRRSPPSIKRCCQTVWNVPRSSRAKGKTLSNLQIADNKLVITSNAEIGMSYEEMPMEDEKITMQFTTPLSPCIIKGDVDNCYQYLALPLWSKE